MSVHRTGPADGAALARLRLEWGAEWGEGGMAAAEFVPGFRDGSPTTTERTWRGSPNWTARRWAWPGWRWSTGSPGPGKWARLAGGLQSVYVVPSHRGKEVGANLVRAVIDEAGVLGLDCLIVHPRERSFSLYRRAGFAKSAGVLELDLRRATG